MDTDTAREIVKSGERVPKSAYSISHSIQTLINALPIHQRSLSNIIIPISQPASPKLPPQRVKMAQSSSNSI
ncbi:hypothetical protein KEM48_000702, partial [Puccinia striiformis f. sp. tritici PST-130]